MTVANPYHYVKQADERTPINYQPGEKDARCQSCKRTDLPLVIDTKFLSRPLKVCRWCRSVIQECEGEK